TRPLLRAGGRRSDTKNLAAGTTYHHNRFENVESRFPSQRRGLSHIYNNYFNNVFISGINVRMGGVAKIESNYFENIKNPVNSRDSSEIGYWDLINNYIGSGITWTTPDGSKPYVNAINWVSSKVFPEPLGSMYTVTPAAQVKAKVIATAGAGKIWPSDRQRVAASTHIPGLSGDVLTP
ncbi:pectate lyase, partial [Xanthomonas vasicola]|uniref:pectate lyase family protein n=1 Tax=Xanthomonas vasicola TaxID=56459 RepID=UPI00068E61BD